MRDKLLTGLALALLLSSCAAGNGTYAVDQAGFFAGIWHGWIAPFALIGHVFDGDIRIYETNNTGIWYDVGFYIAVISGFGSLGLSRSSRTRGRRAVSREARRRSNEGRDTR